MSCRKINRGILLEADIEDGIDPKNPQDKPVVDILDVHACDWPCPKAVPKIGKNKGKRR